MLMTIMAVWRASNGYYYLQRALTVSHLTSSLSRIVCRGQEGPKGSKDTLGPDFLDLLIFLKPMSPQDTERRLQGNQGIVSLRQILVNDV
jgi:hypothetical protein